MAKHGLVGKPIMIRLSPDILKRADAIAERLGRDEDLAAMGGVTRSSVLRLAMVRGLDALESKLPKPRKPKR